MRRNFFAIISVIIFEKKFVQNENEKIGANKTI